MPSKRSRTCFKCGPALLEPPCCRTGLRSSGSRATQRHDVHLPHHIILEVMTYLETRAIVRARGVAQAFVHDAPSLIDTFQFSPGEKFPGATQMDLFPRVAEVNLDGDTSLVEDAAEGLSRCVSLRRLSITRKVPQISPISDAAMANLCSLQLGDLEVRRVRIAVPEGLAMPAWRTLRRLVMRAAHITDASVANLFAMIPLGPLPLRHLDLSRNPIGETTGMRPLADALSSFPELLSLELTANRVSSEGAKRILGALLDRACPKLSLLEMSLNFLDNSVMNFLAEGLKQENHGLLSLEKLGIGGRFAVQPMVTTLEPLSRALAAGGLPGLSFLHLQGDLAPLEVGPVLREFKLGACPNLAVVKVERSTRIHPVEDPESTEDAVESMWELVTCPCVPQLREVHVLGMNLGKGLEWAEEERTPFYRARNESSFHRLALAGANRGVMIFV